MKFDPTRPVRTRDGRAVDVFYTAGVGDYPLFALIEGEVSPDTFTAGGKYYAHVEEEDGRDLVNTPDEEPVSAVEATLAERGKRYGDFTVHAEIAQSIQIAMRAPDGWDLLTDVQRQALTVIADKIARILSGDPNYRDNWHDIQGYAKLAEDRCDVD